MSLNFLSVRYCFVLFVTVYLFVICLFPFVVFNYLIYCAIITYFAAPQKLSYFQVLQRVENGRPKRTFWDRMAQRINNQYGTTFTGDQCYNKFLNLT